MEDIAKLIEFEKKLVSYTGEDKVISAVEALKDVRDNERPKLHARSKIPTLDDITGGFNGGQLIIVSGTTGHGKTTLCQTLTHAFVSQEVKPLWFSYEVDKEDFLNQFEDGDLHHFYLPKTLTGRTVKWIEQRIWEGKLKYQIGVVFIDHLHYLIDLARTQNVSFDIGSIVRNLKRLCVKHNIIIFLVCHTTKTNNEKELTLGDVRDSSFIEQEADIVLYVWRLKEGNKSVVKVAKNRKKGIIDKKIPLVYRTNRYYEEQR